jgi:hypothetical protein
MTGTPSAAVQGPARTCLLGPAGGVPERSECHFIEEATVFHKNSTETSASPKNKRIAADAVSSRHRAQCAGSQGRIQLRITRTTALVASQKLCCSDVTNLDLDKVTAAEPPMYAEGKKLPGWP